MKRRTIDRIVSLIGSGLSLFLFVAAGLLYWGFTFADQNVKDQLSAQNITFPTADSDSFKALPKDDREAMEPFAGAKMTTGEQAMAYAQHLSLIHI